MTVDGAPIIGAEQALRLLRSNPAVGKPAVGTVGLLAARGARLTSAVFDTASGRRRLPAWKFYAGGLSEPLFALASRTRTHFGPPPRWHSRTR